jgi:hypothetical protein
MKEDSTDIRANAWALIEKSAAVLGTLGLALYGIVRVAYDAFYGRLGTSAEEVGLNYITIVTQAALALLGLSVNTILLGTITALGIWPDLRKTLLKNLFTIDPSREGVASEPRFVVSGAEAHSSAEIEGSSPTVIESSNPLTAQPKPILSPMILVHILAVTLTIYLALMASLDLGVIADTLEFLRSGPWRGLALGVVTPMLVAAVVTLLFRKWHGRLPSWPLLRWAAALVLVGLLPALTLSSLIGEHAARKVQQGGELQHQSWLPWLPGPGAFGFDANWMTASWAGGNEPSDLSSATTFIYLGVADGRAVLYCPKHGVTRLPAGNLVMTPPTNGDRRCG